MWFEESNMYFNKIENFANEDINERSFNNPYPCELITSAHTPQWNGNSALLPVSAQYGMLAYIQGSFITEYMQHPVGTDCHRCFRNNNNVARQLLLMRLSG